MELPAWITTQLRLPAAMTAAKRWGASDESPVTITLADGRRIRFNVAADLFEPARLVRTVVLQLGTDAPQMPLFTKADAQDIAIAIVRACEAIEEDNEVAVTAEWQESFLRVTHAVHHGDYGDAHARWAGLHWLVSHPTFQPSDHRLAYQDARHCAPMLVWADGTAYVRVIDVERFVRDVMGHFASPAQIVGRMKEAGWQHRTSAEARRPGAGRGRGSDDRVRVSVFVIPSGRVPEVDVSQGSPDLTRAHAHAHASEGLGHLGTPPESPTDTGDSSPWDTKDPWDTATAEEEELFARLSEDMR